MEKDQTAMYQEGRDLEKPGPSLLRKSLKMHNPVTSGAALFHLEFDVLQNFSVGVPDLYLPVPF
jgi:hypothetical protein